MFEQEKSKWLIFFLHKLTVPKMKSHIFGGNQPGPRPWFMPANQ